MSSVGGGFGGERVRKGSGLHGPSEGSTLRRGRAVGCGEGRGGPRRPRLVAVRERSLSGSRAVYS